MSFAEDFHFVLDAARARFPNDRVYGEVIHLGKGYGIFVERHGIKVCFQVKSEVTVAGKPVDNDIRNHGTKIPDALRQGFDAMEKSLGEMLARQPRGIWQRIKEMVFA